MTNKYSLINIYWWSEVEKIQLLKLGSYYNPECASNNEEKVFECEI